VNLPWYKLLSCGNPENILLIFNFIGFNAGWDFILLILRLLRYPRQFLSDKIICCFFFEVDQKLKACSSSDGRFFIVFNLSFLFAKVGKFLLLMSVEVRPSRGNILPNTEVYFIYIILWNFQVGFTGLYLGLRNTLLFTAAVSRKML